MCDCTVDSDDDTSDFSLVLGILDMRGHALVRSYVFRAWTDLVDRAVPNIKLDGLF